MLGVLPLMWTFLKDYRKHARSSNLCRFQGHNQYLDIRRGTIRAIIVFVAQALLTTYYVESLFQIPNYVSENLAFWFSAVVAVQLGTMAMALDSQVGSDWDARTWAKLCGYA